ncbi:MAG: hypothetical protein JNL10_00025 [Verrucomicrobiales bacterium]|nr:hypothetical protein [Verrucomicrobiales bacterium]
MERPSRFRSADEVCRYVDDQMAAALPGDWKYQRRGGRLEWEIAPRQRDPHSCEDDYLLEVSGEYRFLILYFGNSSAGCDIVGHSMLTAVVLTSESLSSCSLGTAVQRMIERRSHFRLNMWSLT